MRVWASSKLSGWALCACAALSGCGNAPPPPVAGPGRYQPATLAEAVAFRDRTAIENFLALGVDPNEPEPDGTTPLMRAVHGQMPTAAQLLIDAGADVRKANSYGVTALYIAARAGDDVATRMLLTAGADANAALPASGETVLMTAAKAGNPAVVRALLTDGNDNVSLSTLGEARAAARVAEGGAEFVPMVRLGRPENAFEQLRAAGFTIAATVVRGGTSLFKTKLPERVVYILGAEQSGVDSALAQASTLRLAIPGRGAVESLNVASAASVLMAEWLRQH
jgi:tRNA(Leu) C34 or U34 (ribose-2'-O)-methylase TrmL